MAYTIFVGIDVSKSTLDVSILFPEQKKFLHRKVGNNLCGHGQILSWLQEYSPDVSNEILICLEHTGIYINLLCKFLRDNNVKFSVQSALHVKQSLGITRNKNDKSDSQGLARFAYLHHRDIQLTILPTKKIELLRNLVSYRGRLVRSRVSLEVPIAELKEFSEAQVNFEVINGSRKDIAAIEKSIEKIENKIFEVLKTEPKLFRQYELLLTIPGIGPQIAANLIAYTKGFTAFSEWRKFSCFCGIAPFEHTSGTSIKGRTKISKMGNRHLKNLLSQAAVVAANFDPELSKFYKQKTKDGKHKMVALNIIRNKLVSRIFSVIKRGTPYVKLPQSK